jgi:hypothetical protein
VADDLIQEPTIRPPQSLAPENEEREKIATPEQEIAAGGEVITELTDEERGWFETLLTVGRRSRTVTVMGHEVVIQNLNTDDDLRIGLFCKEFQGAPPADARAYQLATCAAGIRTVDGLPVYQPLGETSDQEMFDQKVARLRKYYPVVITQIYREILSLDGEFMELAQKLGKLKG